MGFSHRIVCLLLFACVAMLPRAPAAQENGEQKQDPSASAARKPSAPRPALNEQQRRGKALFVQNCPLCHVPSAQKKRLGIQGPVLQGMFGEDADEDALRQFIQQGIPGKMPGFRYALEPKQVDDLIAFLKAGAYLRTPGGGN
jgi:mono/diheme cytochrome c family protein